MIIFAGPDTCGKDTIMHELAKELNYEPFMSPRSPICNIVYDNLYSRNNSDRFKQNMNLVSKFLGLGAFFVLILVKPEILEQRAKARNEKHVSTKEDFIRHIEEYKRVFDMCKEQNNGFRHRFLVISNDTYLKQTVNDLKKLLDDAKEQDRWVSGH
jgi:thymidylate kinase